tara:strand:- start:3484 stop:3831 length:348 start_codon:yes stop_codon:yes gene_type:complete
MAHTVTLLADHKGMTTPRVHGDEYLVDASLLVTTATSGGEVVTAASLGLSRINAVLITGNSLPATYDVDVECSAAGAYESGTSFALLFTAMDGTNAAANGNITDTTVRVRVYGIL